MKTTGHCFCGAVQYEYEGDPLDALHCHCESCRRHTGSPVATFVIVRTDAFRYTRGQPKEYASSPGVRRSFCSECGSPIAYQHEKRPEALDVFAGTLDNPSGIAPSSHVHAAEQLAWFEILDGLPRFATTRRGVQPVRYGPDPAAQGRVPRASQEGA